MRFKNILAGENREPALHDLPEGFARRTSPSAPTTLLLRFMTEAGPRTVITSGVPLNVASDIAREMLRAGHFAEYVDECPKLSLGERLKVQ